MKPRGPKTAVATCSTAASSEMPVGRFWKVTRLSLLLALIGAQQAHAALFDDEEARRLIKDL